MNRIQRGHYLVLAVPALLVLWGHTAPCRATLPLLWTVSDDTLSTPFGTVIDVAVGGDDVVYLLDSQNMMVRRFSVDGKELAPLGRMGEGPGEFTQPLFVVPNTEGGCIVLQDFFRPAVCLLPSGWACTSPDLSGIRRSFVDTHFLNARADGNGRLLLAAMTTDRRTESTSSAEDVHLANSLFAITTADESPTVLFSDRPELCGETTVRLGEYAGTFLDRYWDVNRAGRIIYAHPSGDYRVVVGHPADGETAVIELAEADTDQDGMERLAMAVGRPVETIPRIAAVHWVGEERFLIKPMAALSGSTSSRGGTFELFDTMGTSYGRSVLECDYDPDQDGFFLSNGILVIIKGGKSAIRADINQKAALIGKPSAPAPLGDPAWDVIRVDAYALIPHYAAR